MSQNKTEANPVEKCCVCNESILDDQFFTPDENNPSYVFCGECYRSYRKLFLNPTVEEYNHIDEKFSAWMRNSQIPASVRDVYRKADDAYWHNKELNLQYSDAYSSAIDDLMLTTGSNFDGYKVAKYIDVISCEIIFKNSFINTIAAGIGDFFNSLSFREKEMTGAMELIDRAKKYVMKKFRTQAVDIGANAVLGIDFETTFGAEIVKISVNGTAVVVDKIE